jgi:hypothetical protein
MRVVRNWSCLSNITDVIFWKYFFFKICISRDFNTYRRLYTTFIDKFVIENQGPMDLRCSRNSKFPIKKWMITQERTQALKRMFMHFGENCETYRPIRYIAIRSFLLLISKYEYVGKSQFVCFYIAWDQTLRLSERYSLQYLRSKCIRYALSLWGQRTRRPLHNDHFWYIVRPHSDFLIFPDSYTRSVWQLPAETYSSEAGETWAKKRLVNFAYEAFYIRRVL